MPQQKPKNARNITGEEKFRALSEAAFEAIFLSVKGICTGQNMAAEEMFGYTLEEALGRPGTAWIAPEDRELVMKHMLEGYEEPYRVTALRKNGSRFLCEIRGKMMTVEDQVVRVTALQDISKQIDAENALELQAKIVEQSPFAIVATDLAGNITQWNKGAEKLYEYSKEEALGQYIGLLYLEDNLHFLENRIIPPLQARGKLELEVDLKRKSGEIFTTYLYLWILHNEEQQPIGMVGYSVDISERVKAERESSERKQYLEGMLKAAPDAVVTLNTETKIVDWNQGAEKLFGYSKEEALGRNIDDLITDKKFYRQAEELTKHVSSGKVLPPMEVERYKKDGTPVQAILSASSILINDELVGSVAIYTNITEQKTAEQALKESEERYRSLFENSPQGIITVDLKGKVTSCNSTFVKLTGYTKEETIGIHFSKIPGVIKNDLSTFIALFTELMKGNIPEDLEFQWQHKNGEIRTGKVFANMIKQNGKLKEVQAIVQDITESRMAEEALRESEEKFRMVATHSLPVIFIIDKDGIFTLSEGKGLEVLGLEPGQVVGASAFEMYKDFPDVIEGLERALNGEQLQQITEVGDLYFNTLYSPIKNAKGEIVSVLGMSVDVTEQKKNEDNLKFLATHDPLTQIPNRVLFNDRLNQAIKRADRNETKLGVLFLDLDGFKAVNDAFGHAAGDILLSEIAGRIKNGLRKNDTVARIGGDEFLVLVEDIKQSSDITTITQKILSEISRPVLLEEQEIFITGSIGISLYPEDAAEASLLIRSANTAMYRAKSKGQNIYEYFSMDMAVRALERITLLSDLRRSMESEDFTIHYQPQIDLETNKATGFEALVRWLHPAQGLLMPGRFIDLAEETGLMIPLDRWIIQKACQQAAKWVEEGCQDLRLCVNLSKKQLLQDDLIEFFQQVLDSTKIVPGMLELELTEKIVFQADRKFLLMLEKLKELGMRISIDDFGIGYTSLGQLTQLPLDMLKIDKSFAKKVTQNEKDIAVLAGILNIARNLDIEVIAEGIETEEQLAIYRDNGCRLIQGYYFSKPVPPEKLGQFLK